jgi:hypothetical protein
MGLFLLEDAAVMAGVIEFLDLVCNVYDELNRRYTKGISIAR